MSIETGSEPELVIFSTVRTGLEPELAVLEPDWNQSQVTPVPVQGSDTDDKKYVQWVKNSVGGSLRSVAYCEM